MSSEVGRHAKFDGLARTYGADLYRFAMWICGDDALAKDLVQETFLRAWKALDNLNDTGAAKSWLITILRREYARTFERKVPKFTDVDTVVVPDDGELEPDARAERRGRVARRCGAACLGSRETVAALPGRAPSCRRSSHRPA